MRTDAENAGTAISVWWLQSCLGIYLDQVPTKEVSQRHSGLHAVRNLAPAVCIKKKTPSSIPPGAFYLSS